MCYLFLLSLSCFHFCVSIFFCFVFLSFSTIFCCLSFFFYFIYYLLTFCLIVLSICSISINSSSINAPSVYIFHLSIHSTCLLMHSPHSLLPVYLAVCVKLLNFLRYSVSIHVYPSIYPSINSSQYPLPASFSVYLCLRWSIEVSTSLHLPLFSIYLLPNSSIRLNPPSLSSSPSTSYSS